MSDDPKTTTCEDCPPPPLIGDPQPKTRCDPCPYHGFIRVRQQRPDGRWETRYERTATTWSR